MNVEEKERLIKKDIKSIENRGRSAFNQGYEMGLKELKDYRKMWDEIKKQIKEESNFAYADFDKYKYEVLGVDDIDELPDDDFRYGMERAIEIINEYIRVVKE